MKRIALAMCVAVASLFSSSSAQQPTFRSSIDLVELDVFVTEDSGAFVKNLTIDDFEILDDGRPQSIASVSLVDLPLPSPSADGRSVRPESDVTTNAGHGSERLWVILLDAPSDYDRGSTYTRRTQNVARGFIESMGPSDSAAIIHVQGTQRASQALTTSRVRLFEAIERFSQGTASGAPVDYGTGGMAEAVTRTRTTFQVIRDVSERLGAISSRRKAVLWIGGQMLFDLQNVSPQHAQLLFAYQEMIRAAQRNHVVIYSIDPSGLGGNRLRYEASLRVIAEDTGGTAVVNTNDYARGFGDIVRDNSTYYLVGYYPNPVHRDGEFHKITVRAKRPGLTVRARRGYLAPTPAETPRASPAPIDELTQALRNPIPRRDVSIELAATPLGSIQAAGSVLLTASARTEEIAPGDAAVDVAFRVIDAEGKTLAERATRYPLGARTDGGGRMAVRFTDRVDLPKGRQEIRLAINMPGGKTGSAVTYVDVSDFKENRLALSGLSVESPADKGIPVFTGGGSEPSDAVVTTDRRFTPSATLRVRARVYGRLDRADDKLLVTALLRNEARAVVRENLPVSIEPGGNVSQERNVVIQVPLTGLQPAAYLLEVSAGSVRNRRPSATRQLPLWVTEQ